MNPWLEAGRGAVAAQAEEQIRAASTDTAISSTLRSALGTMLGRSVSVGLRGVGAHVATLREVASGLLRAAQRAPETFPRSVLTRQLPREDRTYAFTRTEDGRPGILFVNAHWLSTQQRPALVASLAADRATGRPGNVADLMEQHVTGTRPGAGEHRSEPGRRLRPDPLEQSYAIGSARSVVTVAAHLRDALADITNTPVNVALGTDATTDLEAAKQVAQGLITELLETPHEGLSSVEVADLPEQFADAYAMTVPLVDGTYKVVFNSRWHRRGRGEQLRESLRADAVASPHAPGDPEDLAAAQAAPPSAEQPRAASSPRGEVTPYENIERIGEADTIGDIERELREGLGTALGHEVEVSFTRTTDVETAREVSEQLVRSALEQPDAKLRKVRVGPLPVEIGAEFAFTKMHPDGSFDIIFNWHWHVGHNRGYYTEALRHVHAAGLITDPTPAAIADLRFKVPGVTTMTPSDYSEMIKNAQSTAEVEQHLREGLLAATGAPTHVDLEGPGPPHVTSVESVKEVTRGLLDSAVKNPGNPITAVTVRVVRNSHDNTVAVDTYAQVTSWKDPPHLPVVTFNAHWHNEDNRAEYVRRTKVDADNKFTVGGTPYSVGAHEGGHVASRSNPGWMTRTDIPGHPGTMQEEVRAKAARPHSTWEGLAGSVGTYAQKNDEELTAESVADVQCSGANATKVSVVVNTRLEDANRTRMRPLQPLRRSQRAIGPSSLTTGLRGLGNVDAVRNRPAPQTPNQPEPGAPAGMEASRTPGRTPSPAAAPDSAPSMQRP